tara:strand:- start:258 stop:767 length:510 start_codon:yes stop_codon:yes gene_type:complete
MEKKIKLLNFKRYKDIVLDAGKFEKDIFQCWSPNFSHANPHHFKMITESIPEVQRSDCSQYQRALHFRRIHKLVNNGSAYWLNEKTLVTGFYLKNNSDVYIPIFQQTKEKFNSILRLEIKYYAKFIVANMRQKLYKKTLLSISKLDILPEEIIHKIAHLTYDPKYYLKL